ncbi:MAG: AhpC/TSA family protein [Bacteroidetes bacterium]|nr:AhpC/TSA family protein [Bacteroidota bacterium]
MKKKTALLAFLFITALSFGQEYSVKGQIEGLSDEKIYIASFRGDMSRIIDSVSTDALGNFFLETTPNYKPGVYRLVFGRDQFLDLIINNENIRFKTNLESPPGNIQVSSSVENILFYDYLKKRNENQLKLELLNPIIGQYPRNDGFYPLAEAHYEILQNEFLNYTNMIIEKNEGLLVSDFIRFDRPLMIDLEVPIEKQEEYLRKHYFDGLVFDKPILLNLNILPGKIIGYLTLYRDPGIAKVLQEELFRQAVDSILLHMMDNEDIYHFTLKYLIDGFQQFGFDNLVDHIGKTYSVVETCVNEERKSELEKRMENIKKLAVGNIAPDISLKGQPTSLSGLSADYKLVLFWASWCPHCKSIIPGLKDVYQEFPRDFLEIVSVSVDSSQTSYEKTLQELQIPWKHEADFMGWNTQAAADYSIYATPMMFLTDRKMKILYKPSGPAELRLKLLELKGK